MILMIVSVVFTVKAWRNGLGARALIPWAFFIALAMVLTQVTGGAIPQALDIVVTVLFTGLMAYLARAPKPVAEGYTSLSSNSATLVGEGQ